MTHDNTLPQDIALVALTAGGAAMAQRLKETLLPSACVYGLAKRVQNAERPFDDAGDLLRALFNDGTAIVGVCASGILIRALAPVLADKGVEPAVVALAENGCVAVPLLGGHRGANRLADAIAKATGGMAAVTTASEARLGTALDDPPPGWTVRNPEDAKGVTAAWLAGRPVRLLAEAGDGSWLDALGLDRTATAGPAVHVTDRSLTGAAGTLVLHPPTLALGVGCERDVAPEELLTLTKATLDASGLAASSVAVVVSLAQKADEPAVHAVATWLGVPARFLNAETLERETARLANPSDIVYEAVGCHGVAEAAALAAVGADGTLVVPKQRSARATCAVARAHDRVDVDIGQARGKLFIAGTGPGDAAYRSPAVDKALSQTTDIVGYGPYIDLLGNAAARKTRHNFTLGEEELRCRAALDLAAGGRNVMLLSSGDPGIYALATLVFELLDRENDGSWNRVAVDVLPGVSAMQMAAARAGAPLGHDFCALSLSDLLTPWPQIVTRLQAACAADLVIALYNPSSGARRARFHEACEILRAGRPADTPVVVARNVARPEESVAVMPLSQLDPDRVDMLTILLIGNSQSRIMRRGGRSWMYTPRGYAVEPEPVQAVPG